MNEALLQTHPFAKCHHSLEISTQFWKVQKYIKSGQLNSA